MTIGRSIIKGWIKVIKKENVGNYVKTKFVFLGKQKGKVTIWKPGIVVGCHPHFLLVDFEKFKKCFSNDKVENISEQEYQRLLSQKAVRHALVQ